MGETSVILSDCHLVSSPLEADSRLSSDHLQSFVLFVLQTREYFDQVKPGSLGLVSETKKNRKRERKPQKIMFY